MTEYFTMDCGCRFPISNEVKKDLGDGIPSLEINFDEINLQCPKTYELLASGKTLGVFQLEKSLGQGWSKRLVPINIEEIAALISILRPGTLQAKLDGKSMSQHYVDRKHLREEFEPIDESIRDITNETYSIIIFQEESMLIAQRVAGFNLQQADQLRKAMGKKDAELMAKTRIEFIDGCKTVGIISDEKANEIFDIIEKSNRYSFNKCVTLDTTVYVKDGCKTLQTLQVGEFVNSPDGWVKVIDKIDTGEKMVYETELDSGKTIKCTMDHKFLCENGEILPLHRIIIHNYKIVCEGTIDYISDVEYLGLQKTCDITVDSKRHLYYANDIVTSNSHAVGYGLITHLSSYFKSHFPKIFFTSYLINSDNKADFKDEVSLLVNDAKFFGMNFKTPSIISPHENFSLNGLTIEFGLSNISGVGEKYIGKVHESISIVETKLNKKFCDLSWFEILIFFSPLIKSNVFKAFVSVGVFSHLPIYRRYMLFEVTKLETLTERELNWAIDNLNDIKSLESLIELLLAQTTIKITDKRKEKLLDTLKTIRNPPNELKDSEEWISNIEQNLLGVEITCSKLDSCNTSMGNCTCAEFDKADLKEFRIAAKVSKLSEYRPKDGKLKGQTMAYITLNDSTGSCEAVVFPEKYTELDFLLFEGNTLCVTGKKTNSGSLQINKVIQI